MKRLLLLVLTVGVLATVLGVTAATTATTPTPVTCGDVITLRGTYALTGDCTAAGDGIDINASNVTLELAGHTITGPGLFIAAAGVVFGNVSGVHIEGPGTITNFHDGVVLARNTTKSVVTQVTANANVDGIFIDSPATGNKIIDNTALNNLSLDLWDNNFQCDKNQWNANVFGTANPTSCIH
jgi:nitrous oxidase accessory protein NosD